MRQFRMPIQHTKNLSKFKKQQIGTILRDLKEFDEKEKYEAFSYLQGCISKNRMKKKTLRKIKVLKKSAVKQIFKCGECDHVDSKRKGIFNHLESHEGFHISCRKCRRTFNNNLSYNWHLKHCCHVRTKRTTSTFPCTECPRVFFSKQNLNRHLEGHKRNNCTYCDQVITNRKHLIQHLLEVHSIKLERAIYKCGECDKRYVKKRSLHYHKQQHFINKFVCLDCGKVCEDAEEMKEHHRKHEQQKNFRCLRCNQRFTRRQQYLFHMKRHDNYKCITCNETFASKVRMMHHKQKGHDVEGLRPKFSCHECGKDFFLKSKLIFHLRKHTDDKPTLNCQYCDKTFSSPYAYYKHSITMSHEKSSPETSVYICENCGSQFSKKYLLEQHNMRAHNNQKEYITCEFCPYKTKNKANMNRHRETHINLKTFICEQCGKDFTTLASLKGHISYMHTENKMFQCTECDKSFKRNSELVRHQGTHSTDRPHVCKTCGQSYKRSTHLRRHEKSSHKIVSQSRNNAKFKVKPDGSFAPVVPLRDEPQESSMVPVITYVESEPLALVKRKEYTNDVLMSEPSPELTYFDNIVTSNSNSALHDFEEEDIILGMSMISNNAETQYFLSTPYTNDQLIQEYIGQDNLQFVDSHLNNYVPSSNRYVLNNILGFIDSNPNDNN